MEIELICLDLQTIMMTEMLHNLQKIISAIDRVMEEDFNKKINRKITIYITVETQIKVTQKNQVIQEVKEFSYLRNKVKGLSFGKSCRNVLYKAEEREFHYTSTMKGSIDWAHIKTRDTNYKSYIRKKLYVYNL